MKNFLLTILIISGLSGTTFGANVDCWNESPISHYAANSDYNEIQIKSDVISNEELLSIFPSGAKERYYKFPNGLGIYLSTYYKGTHTQMYPNRPVWGIYKTNSKGKRILLSANRFEFSGTVDSTILKTTYLSFLQDGHEVVLCNKNIKFSLATVGMLLLPHGQVIATNSSGGTLSLSAYSSELSYGDDTLPPSLIQKRKMLNYRIRTVHYKNGSRSVREVINKPDGTTQVESKIEFLYEPIEIIEVQFEGLTHASILTSSGFRSINELYNLGEIKDP